jgi:hypothetical protein
MADIGFGVSSKGTLEEALAVIPAEYQGYLRAGFGRLAALDEKKWDALLSTIRDSAPYPSEIELEPIRGSLSLESSDASALVSACRILMGILSFRGESPSEVIHAAVEAKILDTKNEARISAFAEMAARDRPGLKQSLIASSLQHQVLPSLAQFEVRIDLRLQFAGGKISAAAPVAVAWLDTDSMDTELWFQMTRPQIVALEAKLQRAREEIDLAEQATRKLS